MKVNKYKKETRVLWVSWLPALSKIKLCAGHWQTEDSRIQGEEWPCHFSLKSWLGVSTHLSLQHHLLPPTLVLTRLHHWPAFQFLPSQALFTPGPLHLLFFLGRKAFLPFCFLPFFRSHTKYQHHRQAQITQLLCLFFVCLSVNCLGLLNRDPYSLCYTSDLNTVRLLLDTQ